MPLLALNKAQLYELERLSRPEYTFNKMAGLGRCSVRKVLGAERYYRTRYGSTPICGMEETNTKISEMIDSGDPFLVGRFGDAELRTLVYSLERKLHIRDCYPEYIKKVMHMNAGFFPVDDDSLDKFAEYLLAACYDVDMFGVWYNLLEDFIINHFANKPTLVHLECLEPYRCAEPWSAHLAGKKVLVVNPFSGSISHQYARRKLLFDNPDVLPDFNLITYKSVQSNAGAITNYATWFEALNYMYEDISKLEFEIAIVGCGSYGLPLSALLKRKGKQVIHLGGATQILFGVKGARWESKPEVASLFNENWIRPSAMETPPNVSEVEGGCYW